MGKRKQILPIALLALCMLAVVVFAAWRQSGDLLKNVRFQDSRHGQELDLYYDEAEDQHLLFLPGFTNIEDISLTCPRGMSASFLLSGERMELELSTALRSQKVSLEVMQTSQIPSLFIHAEEGLIPYLNEDKSNTRDVVVQFLDGEGQPMLQSTATMYGRGNGSWESPSKRPYNLEFSQPTSVGPFADVTKLCLLAEFSDESRLRNSLAYYAGQELGIDYASAYQFVDVFVNGEYLGLYGIVTKQEYRKHLEEDRIQAVFEIASAQNRVEFFSSLGFRINVLHGSKQEVQQLVNGFEAALVQGDWEACREYINEDSFALKYAMEEFLANLDLAYASQYFYVDEMGKLNCMLPWDYDWTLGSSYHYYNNRQAWELKVHRDANSWYGLLMEQFPFREMAANTWRNQFDDAFLRKLEDHLLSAIQTIGGSWNCEKRRWRSEMPYNPYDLASGVEELEGFYDLFRDYFYKRRDFLVDFNTQWWEYHHLTFFDARWGNFYIRKGEDVWEFLDGASILDVNVPGERFLGWYYEGVPLEEVRELEDWMEIHGRYEMLEEEVRPGLDWWLGAGIAVSFLILSLGGLCVLLRDKKKTAEPDVS